MKFDFTNIEGVASRLDQVVNLATLLPLGWTLEKGIIVNDIVRRQTQKLSDPLTVGEDNVFELQTKEWIDV